MALNWGTISHTADIGLWFKGNSLENLFFNASQGLMAYSTFEGLKGNIVTEIFNYKDMDKESCLIAYLNDLLFLLQVEGIIFLSIKQFEIGKNILKIKIEGLKIDQAKNYIQRDIKQVTYHQVSIIKQDKNWTAHVVLDL